MPVSVFLVNRGSFNRKNFFIVCFDKHKVSQLFFEGKRTSVCNAVRYCPDCYRYYPGPGAGAGKDGKKLGHFCASKRWCRNCQDFYHGDELLHYCFMTPVAARLKKTDEELQKEKAERDRENEALIQEERKADLAKQMQKRLNLRDRALKLAEAHYEQLGEENTPTTSTANAEQPQQQQSEQSDTEAKSPEAGDNSEPSVHGGEKAAQKKAEDPWNEPVMDEDSAFQRYIKIVLGKSKLKKKSGKQLRKLTRTQSLFKRTFEAWKYYVQNDGEPPPDNEHQVEEADFADVVAEQMGEKKLGRIMRHDSDEFDPRWIVFDIESSQNTAVGQNKQGETIFEHVPVLVVAIKSCPICAQQEPETECLGPCGEDRLFRFEGADCMTDFCRWLFSGDHKGRLAISHYGRAYDMQFVLKFLVENSVPIHKVILRGLNLMTLQAGGVRFVDSHLHLPLPLRQLPATFGFENEVVKGDFPFLFISQQNENYVGPVPALHYYQPQHRKKKDREELIEWHRQQEGRVDFNYKEEMFLYCCKDCVILNKSIGFYHSSFKSQNGFSPLECITLPSSCLRSFRRNFLKPKSIGIVPPYGYGRSGHNQSKKALQWILWKSHKWGRELQHQQNGGEKIIDEMPVDGYDPETGHVLQFLGCHFHGEGPSI